MLQDCIIEEVWNDGTFDSPSPAKSSSKNSKKANGPNVVAISLTFKINNKVSYKIVLKGVCLFGVQVSKYKCTYLYIKLAPSMLKWLLIFVSWLSIPAHSAIVLKEKSIADKTEWVSKIRNLIQPSKGVSTEGPVLLLSWSYPLLYTRWVFLVEGWYCNCVSFSLLHFTKHSLSTKYWLCFNNKMYEVIWRLCLLSTETVWEAHEVLTTHAPLPPQLILFSSNR